MTPQEILNEAWQLYANKDAINSSKLCQKLLMEYPNTAEGHYILGLSLGRLGNANIGIRHIKEAKRLRPEFAYYDLKRDLMLQQGVTNHTDLWEACFRQYLLFQNIDAFLISYPKCGRTWLRAMLGKYVSEATGKGDVLELLQMTASLNEFATLEISHDDYPHWKPTDKIFLDKQAYAEKKVIFLVRDPRDTLVSNYFQYTRRGDKKFANDHAFDGNISEFIRHEIGGLANLVAFYNVWADNRNVPRDFLLVTYEETKRDARKILCQVIEFLDWPMFDDDRINSALNFGNFDNLKQLETTNALKNPRLRAPEDGHPEGFKIRRGKVGGYTEYLSADDISYIDNYLREHLSEYYSFYQKGS